MDPLVCYHIVSDLRRRFIPEERKSTYIEYLREAREIKPNTPENEILWAIYRESGLIDCVVKLFGSSPPVTASAIDFHAFALLVARVIILSARETSSSTVLQSTRRIHDVFPRIIGSSLVLTIAPKSLPQPPWAMDVQYGVLCTVDCAYVNTGTLSFLDLKTRQSIAEILVRYYLDHTERPDLLKLDDMSMLYRLVPGLAAADRSLDVYDQVIRRTTSQYDARRASDYLLRVLQTHDDQISAVMGIALFLVFLNKGSEAPFRRAIWEADMISAVINSAWNWIRVSATDAWEGNLLRQICLHSATLNTVCGVSRAQRSALTMKLLKESDFIQALAKGLGTIDLELHSDCLTTLQPVLNQVIDALNRHPDQIDQTLVTRWLIAARNFRVLRRCIYDSAGEDPVKKLWDSFNVRAGFETSLETKHRIAAWLARKRQ
ncbi:hypothetical protein FRC04_011257 [Tulasnella sp. 424]|nr:hypothetical protein FRC04_011257 [Tulasnella sp. 424]